jgi:hypothetical protein
MWQSPTTHAGCNVILVGIISQPATCPVWNICVEGFTDNVGSRDANLRLPFPGNNPEICSYQASAPPSQARLLDDCELALVHLEIEHLPRLRLFAGQMLFNIAFEFFLEHVLGPVQPSCTIEVLPVASSHFLQPRCLRSAHRTFVKNASRRIQLKFNQNVCAVTLSRFGLARSAQELLQGSQKLGPR